MASSRNLTNQAASSQRADVQVLAGLGQCTVGIVLSASVGFMYVGFIIHDRKAGQVDRTWDTSCWPRDFEFENAYS